MFLVRMEMMVRMSCHRLDVSADSRVSGHELGWNVTQARQRRCKARFHCCTGGIWQFGFLDCFSALRFFHLCNRAPTSAEVPFGPRPLPAAEPRCRSSGSPCPLSDSQPQCRSPDFPPLGRNAAFDAFEPKSSCSPTHCASPKIIK